MSQNCPFCPEEPNLTPSQWGLSPEGWKMMKELHDREHSTPPQPTPEETLGTDIIAVLEKRISINDCAREILGLVHRAYGQPHEGTGEEMVEVLEKQFRCKQCRKYYPENCSHICMCPPDVMGEEIGWKENLEKYGQDWRERFDNNFYARSTPDSPFCIGDAPVYKEIKSFIAKEIEDAVKEAVEKHIRITLGDITPPTNHKDTPV